MLTASASWSSLEGLIEPTDGRQPVRRLVAASAACALAVSPLVVVASQVEASTAQHPGRDAAVYIVILRPQPLATYDGHLRGFAATTPHSGHRFRADTPAVRAYGHHLVVGQRHVLAVLGNPRVLYSYRTAVDGFAAELTRDQVTQAMSMGQVRSVDASQLAQLDSARFGRSVHRRTSATSSPASAAHLGDKAGHGEVIGVIDSGIWPENPSFAGLPIEPAQLRRTYPGFTGTCRAGRRWTRHVCNDKVLAARYFLRGFGRGNLAAVDFASPRDGDGHGSHTAASAAGNAGVDARIGGQDFGHISGAAPGAALSIYKACWTAPDPSQDGCTTADTVKAVDQAVSDGVDVISYSIGSTGSATDPIEQAFTNATKAGIFVAVSAGDDGPAASTVAPHGPAVTTVAAADDNPFRGSVVLGNGQRYAGSMVSDRKVGPSRLVYAADARAAGASVRHASRCYPGALDAKVVDAAVVVCERGGIARVAKSVSVQQSGGVAMVLVNTAPGATDADVHAVPTVQVSRRDGGDIRSYIRSHRRPTASLDPAASTGPGTPRLASFSSRGPVFDGPADVLKPDVTAPGVAVLSAVSPPADYGRLWDLASGTSMAAPQVAGMAADIMAAHPGWSPAAVKSALMTTSVHLPGGGPLAQGAGEVDLRRALDPGLVYDSVGGSSRNLASVSVGDLVATRTVTRRVTNVANRTETYRSSVRGLPGLNVSVAPSTMTLTPGQSRRYSLTFVARRSAQYDRFVGGSVTWSGSLGHEVTSPVVVRAVYVDPPQQVAASGSSGTAQLTARAGVTGTLATTLVGPVAGRRQRLSLSPDVLASHDPTQTGTSWSRTYDIRPGTAAIRFDVSAGAGHDVDLYLYRRGQLVSSAVSPAAREQLTVADPAAGRYVVYVDAVAARSRTRPVTADFTAWVLPRAARDPHFTVRHRRGVTGGRPFSVDIAWSKVDPAQRWFAELRYQHSSAVSYLTVN
jgi:hypothetical protein